MVSVDKAYMIGHMRNANGSLNNKNVVLSAACEAAELFQCMMEINQKLDDWQRFNHTLNMHLRSVECEKIHDICQAVYAMRHPSKELEGLRYNQTKDDETELRTSILQQLAGKLGNNVVIKPPFQCDYGYNLILGDNVFMNYGCSILDCNVVEIGNNVLMAPNVQIYAAYHPTDHTLRLKDLEYADRVKIGDNTWIGGGSIILNGVTIGKNTVIGAGSVVTKDIPDNVVAVGNPCRVIKRLDKENVENGKRLKFTDFAHINIVVDDIDEGIKYYEQLLEAKPIQIFREFSNIGFAKAAGFLEHPELVKLSIAFMEIPGTKLTLELMEYYEPVTTDAKHREDVNKINGVRHVA